MSRTGSDVKDGWHLFVNGEWGNMYRYKSDAVAAMKKCMQEDLDCMKLRSR